MLKLASIGMIFLTSCSSWTNNLEYCAANEITTINFTDKIITFSSGGVSDQQFPIIPCAESIKNCFMGEISFVNPFNVSISRNRNIVSMTDTGKNGILIVGRTSTTQISYYITRHEEFPTALEITDLRTGEAHTFSRC